MRSPHGPDRHGHRLALLFEGDDYIGSAVNLAARLSDVSGPGEVLMPVEQAVDLPEGVTASPHGVVELRGFPEPVTVVNLSGTPILRGRNDTGELWTRSPSSSEVAAVRVGAVLPPAARSASGLSPATASRPGPLRICASSPGSG